MLAASRGGGKGNDMGKKGLFIGIFYVFFLSSLYAVSVEDSFNQGIINYEAKQYDVALQYFLAYLEQYPDNAKVNSYVALTTKAIVQDKVDALNSQGKTMFEERRFFEALDIFVEVIGIDGSNEIALDYISKINKETLRLEQQSNVPVKVKDVGGTIIDPTQGDISNPAISALSDDILKKPSKIAIQDMRSHDIKRTKDKKVEQLKAEQDAKKKVISETQVSSVETPTSLSKVQTSIIQPRKVFVKSRYSKDILPNVPLPSASPIIHTRETIIIDNVNIEDMMAREIVKSPILKKVLKPETVKQAAKFRQEYVVQTNYMSVALLGLFMVSSVGWIYEKKRKHIAEHSALMDPLLKNLYCRGYADKMFPNEIERTERTGLNLSFIMVDIDHFKKFNDDFGHQIGDRVLKGIASIIRSRCREIDTPFRYGGEEMAVILPFSNESEGYIFAESLREMVEKAKWEGIDSQRVTISIGVAQYSKGLTAKKIIEMADQALYYSKEKGRNRVTTYSAVLSPSKNRP